jgi:hypothetical protein
VRVFVDSSWREVSGGRAFIEGAWRRLVAARVYDGTAWADAASFVQPLSVSIEPDPVTRSVTEGTTGQTANVTATPTGGRAPFSYTWARVSGDTSITATSATSATTRFSRFVPDTDTYSAVWQVTVTDADGTTATDTVSVSFFGVIDPIGGGV